MIKPLFRQKESSCLDSPGHVLPQFFTLMKSAVYCMLPYPGVYGTFGSYDVDLIATSGDSVYSARCFRAPFIFSEIQGFVNFHYGFIH